MSAYSCFARYYDALTANVGYARRAAFFDSLVKKFGGKTDGILLDLACGTGSLSEELARLGYDVIGTDISCEMLNIAMDKKAESGLAVQYLCQDMRRLDMFGTVDVTVCALDSLNHLHSFDDVKRVFGRVSLFTPRDGLFLFDVNTIHKHRDILGCNNFVYETDEVYCVWENTYTEEKHRVGILLNFFENTEKNNYVRSSEEFSELAYPLEDIAAALTECGFEICGIFDEDTENEGSEASERVTFAAKKIKSANE